MSAPSNVEKFFDSSHLTSNINQRVARSGAVTLTTQALKFAIRTGSTAVLARLLTPADYGLIASVTVVTGVIEMFKDSGLSLATVQQEKITHKQISTLFWINIALAICIAFIKMALAPLLAWMYNEPRLLNITLVLACVSIFGGIPIQHQALLQRRMQFGRLAVIDILSMVIGIATAIIMAKKGYSYWSLIGMSSAITISTVILSFVLSGWIPSLPVRESGVKEMLGFGGNLAGAGFFSYLTRNADTFILGLFLGPTALGVYNRGYSLFLMPMQQFLPPISKVVMPALARLRADPEKFRAMVLEKSYFVVFFVILVTGFSFAASPELVRIVLGPAWMDAVPIVRCLSLGGAIYGTNIAGSWVNTASGRSGKQLRVAMIVGPTYTISFLIGAYIGGAVGVACAFSITCVILRYPVFKYLLKGSPITPQDLMRPLVTVGIPVTIASLLSMIAVSGISGEHTFKMLAIKILVYSTVLGVFAIMRALKLPKVSLKG